ncbi:hypothetical protein AB1L88_12230 [Tautonia sp. JC769]|uniref:hypothetical protein n=1 Tax=Tautonia sp. JC769 TaxID=3232135 RepID=UPI003457825D
MDSPLFDHDLDGPPHLGAADVRVRRETDAKSGKGPAGGPKPRMEQAGDRPGIGWIEGVTLSQMIGLGLLLGLLLSSPAWLVMLLERGKASAIAETEMETETETVTAPAVVGLPIVEAEAPRAPREVVGLAELMEGARRTAASSGWIATGRPDPLLMTAVEDLVDRFREATGEAGLRLPVRFDEVTPMPADAAASEDSAGVLSRALQVAVAPEIPGGPAVLRVQEARESILIADGDIVVSYPRSCLIVATGAVEVGGFATDCVVFAGRMVRCYGDSNSLLAAGSKVRVDGLIGLDPVEHRAIYSAPDRVAFRPDDRDVTVVNAGSVTGPPDWPDPTLFRRIQWSALDLGDARRADGDLPEGLVRFGQARSFVPTVPGKLRAEESFYVESADGASTLTRLGEPIADAEGRAIPVLEGWTPYRISDGYSMLWDGRRYLDVPHEFTGGGVPVSLPGIPGTPVPPATSHRPGAGIPELPATPARPAGPVLSPASPIPPAFPIPPAHAFPG